jgi:hypothetical protein
MDKVDFKKGMEAIIKRTENAGVLPKHMASIKQEAVKRLPTGSLTVQNPIQRPPL